MSLGQKVSVFYFLELKYCTKTKHHLLTNIIKLCNIHTLLKHKNNKSY